MKLLARGFWVILIVLLIIGLINFSSSIGQVIVVNRPPSNVGKAINQEVDHDSIYPTYGIKISPRDYETVVQGIEPIIIGCDLPGCYPLDNVDESEIELHIEFKGNEFQQTLGLDFEVINFDTSFVANIQNLVVESVGPIANNPTIEANRLVLSSGKYIIKHVIGKNGNISRVTPRLTAVPPANKDEYGSIFYSIEQKIEKKRWFSEGEYYHVNDRKVLQFDFIRPFTSPCFTFKIDPLSANQKKAINLASELISKNVLVELGSLNNGGIFPPSNTLPESLKRLPILVIKGTTGDVPLVFLDAECVYQKDNKTISEIYNDYQIFPTSLIGTYVHRNKPSVSYYYYYLGNIQKRKQIKPSVHILTQNFRMTEAPLTIESQGFRLSGIALLPRITIPINVVIADKKDEISSDEVIELKNEICEELIVANCLLRANRTGIKLEKIGKDNILGPLPYPTNENPESPDLRPFKNALINGFGAVRAQHNEAQHERFYINENIIDSLKLAPTVPGPIQGYYLPKKLNIYYFKNSLSFQGQFILDNLIYIGSQKGPETLTHELGHAFSLHHTDLCEFRCHIDGSNNAIPYTFSSSVDNLKLKNIMCNPPADQSDLPNPICDDIRINISIGQVMKMNASPFSRIREYGNRTDLNVPCEDSCDDFLYDINYACPCTGLTGVTPYRINAPTTSTTTTTSIFP